VKFYKQKAHMCALNYTRHSKTQEASVQPQCQYETS